jgi:phosphoadenosine phosphosulfate reductase
MALIDEATLSQEVEAARKQGIDREAREVIRWAHGLLGDKLMMSTAFQKGGMVILHMTREIIPELPIYFLDTGFHFPETLEFIETLRRDWRVNLILQRPKLYGEAFKAQHGEKPYETNPDLCCHNNKTEPMAELLENYQGWITAVRRDQASTRANAEPLEILEGPKLKVQPLALWGRAQVESYLQEHKVPLHPLYRQGYSSIGCAPCTRPCSDPQNERAGRWVGKAKTECGLHTHWKKIETADEPVGTKPLAPIMIPAAELLGKVPAARTTDTRAGQASS